MSPINFRTFPADPEPLPQHHIAVYRGCNPSGCRYSICIDSEKYRPGIIYNKLFFRPFLPGPGLFCPLYIVSSCTGFHIVLITGGENRLHYNQLQTNTWQEHQKQTKNYLQRQSMIQYV